MKKKKINLSVFPAIRIYYFLSFLFCLLIFIGHAKGEPVLREITAIDTLGTMDNEFSIPELSVLPSPKESKSISFPSNDKVIDYDVSPGGGTVCIVVTQPGNRSLLRFWNINEVSLSDSLPLPVGFTAKAIAWHPLGNSLYVMGTRGSVYQICRVAKKNNQMVCQTVFTSSSKLRRLVFCPRPYIVQNDYEKGEAYYAYRMFFGMDNGDNSYRIVSITDMGNRLYQIIGPGKTQTKAEDYSSGEAPSTLVANWALPVAFHPGGHELVWEDNVNQFYVARYNSKYWGDSKKMNFGIDNKGSITPTPNGLGLIHWQKDKSGIGIYLICTGKESRQLEKYTFVSTPSSVPDGKGIVGLTNTGGTYRMYYLPVEVPLFDVVNSWMFVSTPEELTHFENDWGLFRPNKYDQLYKLYESENYYCNMYDRSAPTRPYLVTTDIFWELFGAAYQGLFIIKERDEAVGNFRKFISEANNYLKVQSKESVWRPVFEVLNDFYSGNVNNPEVVNIRNEKDGKSTVSGLNYSFSDLKPRGYYTSSIELSNYFKAFRYFTTIYKENVKKLNELNNLPPNITNYAKRWINAYSGFISPSRSPLVWNDMNQEIPSYCNHPGKEAVVFPLSWGFDNEVFNSTVYHPDFLEELQVKGNNGVRLLPSGIDIAAALGSQFAENLLQADYTKYPPLRKVIGNLKKNFSENYQKRGKIENLYDQWINTIAVQWADTLPALNKDKGSAVWQAKRLQTGLATWATLRHATILVNERTAAECGEGGFEEILMRAPRGYVEPDPGTFGAIASLFETALNYVSSSISNKQDIGTDDMPERKSLYEGIIFRLKEAAGEARQFQAMALKEQQGISLSNEENEKILYVARTAEHLFLIFNSLANPDYALSEPEPIAKIADVAGDGSISPYLMAAVGNIMEWDYVVPYYGRHEMVKGSVYSYYEFNSPVLLDDNQWRERVTNEAFLPWIKPYVTGQSGSNMPKTFY